MLVYVKCFNVVLWEFYCVEWVCIVRVVSMQLVQMLRQGILVGNRRGIGYI